MLRKDVKPTLACLNVGLLRNVKVIVSTLLLRSDLQYSKCKDRNNREYPNYGQSDLQPYHPCGYQGPKVGVIPETADFREP